MAKFIIAIDGGAAAGKSTTAQEVAKQLNFKHINTGAIYRLIAMLSLKNNLDLTKDVEQIATIAKKMKINFMIKHGIPLVYLDGQDVTKKIRVAQISQGASVVAKHEKVRAAVLQMQRGYAEHNNIVMEGRDIGSVVFPKANLKIFLTASNAVRAQRRLLEYETAGNDISLQEVEKEILVRDERDAHRDISPLMQTADAVVIDNTTMTKQEVVDEIVKLAHIRMNAARNN